jgi:hypothetical protein
VNQFYAQYIRSWPIFHRVQDALKSCESDLFGWEGVFSPWYFRPYLVTS